jgi:hypothetical protein
MIPYNLKSRNELQNCSNYIFRTTRAMMLIGHNLCIVFTLTDPQPGLDSTGLIVSASLLRSWLTIFTALYKAASALENYSNAHSRH